jgi:PhnB protein
MIQISPYFTFNGNCREAMTFYQTCLGGELTFQTVAETPIADQCPTGMQQHIMHSQLVNDGAVLMATDMTRSGEVAHGSDIAISVNFDSEEEIRACYSGLSDGGTIIDPLKEAFGNSLFGVVQDKYGKVWMLNHELSKSQP